MAYSFWVLARREALPSVDDLATAANHSEFALKIDDQWAWGKHEGWLPMQWRGQETGCEIELEKLKKKAATAAAKAGFPDLDCAIVITTRGWESLQVGAILGALIATLARGCILEDEGDYLPCDQAMAWARKSIQDADEALLHEARVHEARQAAEAAGNLEVQFANELQALVGQVARFRQLMGIIGLEVPSGHRISARSWRLHLGDRRLDNTRYASVRMRQMQAYDRWSAELGDEAWAAGRLTPAQQRESDALDSELEEAGTLDETDANAAAAIMQAWPADMRIEKVHRPSSDSVEIVFSGDGCQRVEFVGEGPFSTISFGTPLLQFEIAEEVRLL